MPSIICRRHHADDILAKKMKKNPQAYPPIRYLCILLYCSEVWWRKYVWIPLILVPPIFDFCVYHYCRGISRMEVPLHYCSFLPFTPTIVCNKRHGQYITIHSSNDLYYVFFSSLYWSKMVAVLLFCWSAYNILLL